MHSYSPPDSSYMFLLQAWIFYCIFMSSATAPYQDNSISRSKPVPVLLSGPGAGAGCQGSILCQQAIQDTINVSVLV